jgi:hypothetical protein
MKTLTEKVAEATQFINFAKDSKEAESFMWDCLNQLGINDDDLSYELLMSNDCKEGDFRTVFCDKMKLAVPRFRRIWKILKGGSKENLVKSGEKEIDLTQSLIDRITPIGQYSDKQLLDKYGVDCDLSVETELKVRSEQRCCIVFNEDDTINKEISLKLLREARRREIPSTYKDKSNKVYRVYRVGQFPEQIYTRCPVTGSILFDGYCDALGVSWDIPIEALQFIAVLVNEGVEVNALTARDLQKEFVKNGMDGLKSVFPKIATTFEELKEIGELPNLKARLSARDAVQDPFGSKRY